MFNELDLFPLVELEAYSYSAIKAHSEMVDRFLGFKISEIEKKLEHNYTQCDEQLWIGLPIQSLQTPYIEIRQMLSILNLKAGSRIIDLGSAYGRMGFVIGKHYRDLNFLGIEKVPERVSEGERCIGSFNYQNVKFRVADLAAPGFVLPQAEVYFLYDFGTKAAIRLMLDQIKDHSKRNPITVVGRGRASRDVIERECPWLSLVVKPVHYSNFSIYKTA